MSSRARAKCWLVSVALGALTLGCQAKPVDPIVGGKCTSGAMVPCICPGGVSQGFIPCDADRTTAVCGGCAMAPVLPTQPSATGSASASGAALGVAGQSASAFAGRGAAGGGSIGAAAGSIAPSVPPVPPVAAGSCSPGEMCKVSLRGGGVSYCTIDPSATLPPPCTTPNAACGSNGRGTCVDARSLGSPGQLFCVVSSC